MKEKLFAEIDRLKGQMIDDLKSLIKIPSVRSESLEDAPFGENCKKVLNKALEICSREGLEITNIDNYMGYGSYGESNDYIGIIGHLDVVEEGEGWTNPPYSGNIQEGKIYSRGALDNKGPTIAALYGLLAFKNLGIVPKREIRIIFGTNEETGMEDIEYYLSKERAPLMGFTPDNKFPAIYGERGRINLEFIGDILDIELFMKNFIDPKGDKLGIACRDDDFGELLITQAKIENDILKMSIAIPVCDIDEIINRIKAKAVGLEMYITRKDKWVLKGKDSDNVIALNQAYNDVMETNLEPTTTKGMTYAHKCETIIPFGPSFPGQNGIAHLPDEWFDIEDLIKCAKIYAWGLYKLNEV